MPNLGNTSRIRHLAVLAFSFTYGVASIHFENGHTITKMYLYLWYRSVISIKSICKCKKGLKGLGMVAITTFCVGLGVYV